LLVAVIWLRTYPVHLVLGFLFGVSGVTVGRLVGRWVPVLEPAGRDTMRLPDPGKKRHRRLDALLADTPELAVIIDTLEQPVQRPPTRAEADGYYSGKKKRHTLKSQIAIDEHTGTIADVAESVPGPRADLTVLKDSGLMQRLPCGVGGLGDLAHLGLAQWHPGGLGQRRGASRAINRVRRKTWLTTPRFPSGASRSSIPLAVCGATKPSLKWYRPALQRSCGSTLLRLLQPHRFANSILFKWSTPESIDIFVKYQYNIK
jgi:hypothetical protein